MRVHAAGRCLSIYNDTWREEGDPAIDVAEFCARLTNPGIMLLPQTQGSAHACGSPVSPPSSSSTNLGSASPAGAAMRV